MTFHPGEVEKQAMVQVINDKNIEYDETLLLYLTSGEGVHLTPFARAEVVIVNDDGKQSW